MVEARSRLLDRYAALGDPQPTALAPAPCISGPLTRISGNVDRGGRNVCGAVRISGSLYGTVGRRWAKDSCVASKVAPQMTLGGQYAPLILGT